MRFIKPLAVSALIFSSFSLALAQPQGDEGVGGPRGGGHEGFFSESEKAERREEFKELREKWPSMSREEKLSTIETRRAERIKKREEKFKTMTDQEKLALVNDKFKKMHDKMDSKWKSMSDDEKIAFVERRMSGKGGHHRGGSGKGRGRKWRLSQDVGEDTVEQP